MEELPTLLASDRKQLAAASATESKDRVVLVGVVIVLASYLPMLFLHFAELWHKPHYRYFPFLLVAVGCLLRQRWRLEVEGERRRILWVFDGGAVGVLGVSLLGLLLALMTFSPRMAAVSFVISMGVWARLLATQGRLENPFGVWCLLWLLIPLPVGVDNAVLQWVYRVTTSVSSKILDIAGRFHVVEGLSLSLSTKTFFVDQACGGMLSLMGMFAVMLVIVVWRRRGLVHSLLLLASSVFWACFLSVLCVLIVGVAWSRFSLDLNIGAGRDVLGVVLFFGACLAGLSTDALFKFLFTPLDDSRIIGEMASQERSPLLRWWNTVMSWQLPEWRVAIAVKWRRSWAQVYFVALAVLGVLLGGLSAYDWTKRRAIPPEQISERLSGETLATTQAGWMLVDFLTESRDPRDVSGEHSIQWAFQWGDRRVQVALNYPFPSGHGLTESYVNRGWSKESEELLTSRDWALRESYFQKPSGERGFLLSSLCLVNGEAVGLLPGRPSTVWRKMQKDRPLTDEPLCQIQAWVSGEALTPEQAEEVRQAFLDFRAVLRKELQVISGEPFIAT